ncbi:MAG: sulfite exporter TauE/SafE family protein [Mycobacteriales bacterium]
MTPLEALGIAAAGFGAGGINAIVGSGSLITFPTLLALGYPSVLANVTNTVGIFPGSFSGVYGYRRELRGQAGRCVRYGAATVTGAAGGAILLLTLPSGVFDSVVPVLILLACVLMAVQPWLVRRLTNVHARKLGVAAVVGVFGTGVYGGYFGAAQGVILIALLSVVVDDELQRLNALKNVLAGLANLVGAIVFVIATHIAWGAAGLIALGSIIGGQVGAAYGRRIPAKVLRWIVVVAGTAVAVILFTRN